MNSSVGEIIDPISSSVGNIVEKGELSPWLVGEMLSQLFSEKHWLFLITLVLCTPNDLAIPILGV